MLNKMWNRRDALLAPMAFLQSSNPAVEFSQLYNAWINRNQLQHKGVLDAQEAKLWRDVKIAWKKLEQTADNLYQ